MQEHNMHHPPSFFNAVKLCETRVRPWQQAIFKQIQKKIFKVCCWKRTHVANRGGPKRIEEEEEAAAAIEGERQVQSVNEGEEPELAQTGVMWLCRYLSAIETESKFLSCSKSQQCQFLLEEIAESAKEKAICAIRTERC